MIDIPDELVATQSAYNGAAGRDFVAAPPGLAGRLSSSATVRRSTDSIRTALEPARFSTQSRNSTRGVERLAGAVISPAQLMEPAPAFAARIGVRVEV